MKNLLSLVSLCLILSACSAPLYDNNEYTNITQVRQLALNGKEDCHKNSLNAVDIFGNQIEDKLSYFKLYTEYRLNNVQIHKASTDLYDIVKRFIQVRNNENKVSIVYCESKFQNIYEGASDIARVIALEEW